jgi:hypothetical protein
VDLPLALTEEQQEKIDAIERKATENYRFTRIDIEDQKLELIKNIRNILLIVTIVGFIIIFTQLGGLNLVENILNDYELNKIFKQFKDMNNEVTNHTILAQSSKDLCLFEEQWGYKICAEMENDNIQKCKEYSYHGITLDTQDCVALNITEYYEDEDGEEPLDLNVKVQEHEITLIPVERLG